MFGRPIEGENVAQWGARAIYKGYTNDYFIDFVWDRQSCSEGASERFIDWVNNRGMKWLRQEVADAQLGMNDPDVLTFEEGPYRLEAATNASYGYLYIGAVQRREDAETGKIEVYAPKRICSECGKKQIKTSKRFERLPGDEKLFCEKCKRRIQTKRIRDREIEWKRDLGIPV